MEPESRSPNFDDKMTMLQITKSRLTFSFYKIAATIKRRVSFFSIYHHDDEMEMLKARHELLQKQCRNVMRKIMERQDTLEDRLFISEVASEKYDKEKSNYIN